MSLRAAVWCVAIFSLPIGSAEAQTQTTVAESVWTVSGIGGLGQTWDDESDLGQGLLAGVRVERVLASGLIAEAGVDWLSHTRRGGFGFRAEGHTTFLTGALKYRWGRARANGYVLGGLTFAIHSGTNFFEDTITSVSSHDPGLMFGGGAVVGGGRHWAIGPEARMAMLSPHSESPPHFVIYGGVRVAFEP